MMVNGGFGEVETVRGNQLRAARHFLYWTIDELAERSGVSPATIRTIEHEQGFSTVSETPVGTFSHRQKMRNDSVAALVKTLEKAGISFTSTAATVGVALKIKGR